MLGADLPELFQSVYHQRSRYMVMFISANYVQKHWTTHERRSGQARALVSKDPYILPVRLDGTTVPGMHDTMGFLDARLPGIKAVAEVVAKKVSSASASSLPSFNGDTPRTAEGLERLLMLKPGGWEYYLYAGSILLEMSLHEGKYADFIMNYHRPTDDWLTDEEVARFADRKQSEMFRLLENFSSIFMPEVWDAAFGKPGETGDAAKIKHLASRYVDTYVSFLDWVASLRTANCSEDGNELLKSLASSATLAVPKLRESAEEIAHKFNGLSLRDEDSAPIEIQVKIALDTPDTWADDYTALRATFLRGDHQVGTHQ